MICIDFQTHHEILLKALAYIKNLEKENASLVKNLPDPAAGLSVDEFNFFPVISFLFSFQYIFSHRSSGDLIFKLKSSLEESHKEINQLKGIIEKHCNNSIPSYNHSVSKVYS